MLRGTVSLVSGVGSDGVPVGPDVEWVVAEHDGGVVGLFVGESVGAPAGDGAAGDADASGEGADGWVAGGGEQRVEGSADSGECLVAHRSTSGSGCREWR